MEQQGFCEDLKVEIQNRTEVLLADETKSFAEKAVHLGEIATQRRLSYSPEYVQSSVDHAAERGTTVAALVDCDVVPMMEGVFVGTLAPDPLTLTQNGAYLAVKSGNMVRAYTNNNGHDYRWGLSSRAREQITPVENRRLHITRNNLIPAKFTPNPLTFLADETIAKIEGLDFKIAYEGVNLPEILEDGSVNNERYDRLGLLDILGDDYIRLVTHTKIPATF